MPKVNTRFFVCPDCKQCSMFREKTYATFIVDNETPNSPGMIYQKDIEYSCVRCGHIVKKETKS